MSLSLLLPVLLGALQGTPAAPFGFGLPEGYADFAPRAASQDSWLAARRDGQAQFLVEHWVVENPGAFPESVAEFRRRNLWEAHLSELQHEITAWSGRWAGQTAAGTEIRYQVDGEDRMLRERLVVLAEHLVVATWEGPAGSDEAAALATLRLPEAWMPAAPEDHDADRGRGGGELLLPPYGRLDLLLDVGDGGRPWILVDLTVYPADDRAGPWTWRLPEDPRFSLDTPEAGARPGAAGTVLVDPLPGGAYRLRYRIDLESGGKDQRSDLAGLGILFGPNSAAFLEPRWLASPVPPEIPGARLAFYGAPAWRLRARVPAAVTAISALPVADERLEEDRNTRLLVFPEVAAESGWPFLLVGMFRPRLVHGRTVWLRQGSRSLAPAEPVGLLARLSRLLKAWLPAAATDWSVATFPAPDRSLPGLILLDEKAGWLRQPVDARRGGLTRRVGLARQVAVRVFGLQLRGLGSAGGFLESSLAEYAAWRLLLDAGLKTDASELLAAWRAREATAGELHQPLSRVPRSDLEGPRRLLTRGPLVWRAIEERAGRKTLDAVLGHFLKATRAWTTEDLRSELERVTGQDWEPFFHRFLYGRELPADD